MEQLLERLGWLMVDGMLSSLAFVFVVVRIARTHDRNGGRKMKVLVATKEGQGIRKNDFCWVPEGEIVHFGFECDRDKEGPDGHCGCRRAMVGLECAKATTTMKVAEVPVKRREIVARLKKHYREDWKMKAKEAEKIVKDEMKDLADVVAVFPLGAVIEKRGNVFQMRKGA